MAAELRSVGSNTQVHVISAYGGLMLGNNGCIFVPCNTDATSLLRFLRENSPAARSLAAQREKIANELAATAEACRNRLSLRALTWDAVLEPRRVLGCLQRLEDTADGAGPPLLADLRVHIGASPRYYVTSDGRLSIPVECCI
jgi:hypothetical protein